MNKRQNRWIVGSSALVAALLYSHAYALARHPNDVPIPDPIRNAIVRVATHRADEIGWGTGTIIDVKRVDAGIWLCVLTADHVVVGYRSVWIGFGNGGLPGRGGALEYQADRNMIFRGPENADGTRVDLAVLGVFIPANDLNRLPNFNPVPLGAGQQNLGVVQAGYGLPGRIDNDVPDAYVVEGILPDGDLDDRKYGTLRSGNESVDATRDAGWSNNRGTWRFNALWYSLSFRRNNAGDWPPIEGDAYILAGDSGGPSFDAEWNLVGVHSASRAEVRLPDGRWVVRSGFGGLDVNVGAYNAWIQRQCALVPEPASLLALAVGIAGLLTRRRPKRS